MPTELEPLYTQQDITLANTVRLVGDTRFASEEDEWVGRGLNASRGSSQVTRLTFAAPGTLPVGAKVYITISRRVEGILYPTQIELANNGTSAINLAQTLADRISGTTTSTDPLPRPELIGYSAAIVAASPVVAVDITSPVGESFEIETGNFGVTVNAIAHPAAPAIVTTTAAGSAVAIPFGRAIVTNLALNAANYPSQSGGVIATEYDKLVGLPTNSTTERFAGWASRPGATYITPPYGSRDLEAYQPNEPVRYVRSEPLHPQQVLLKLEQLPSGTTVPASLVGQPLYYRKLVNGVYQNIGAPSILGTGDNTRAAAMDDVTNRPWIVLEVADAASNLVWAGLKGY